MSETSQSTGYCFLALLAAMIVILIVSIVKPFSGSEPQSRREPVVTETIPVREVGVGGQSNTRAEAMWEGTM